MRKVQSERNIAEGNIGDLTPELLQHVFSFFKRPQLVSSRLVSRTFNVNANKVLERQNNRTKLYFAVSNIKIKVADQSPSEINYRTKLSGKNKCFTYRRRYRKYG